MNLSRGILMKLRKQYLGALACLCLCACGGDGKGADAPRAPEAATPPAVAAVAAAPAAAASAAAPRQLLQAWLAAWNAHDQQRLGLLLADDVEYFDAGFAGIQRGREAAIENGVSVFLRGLPDLRWELRGEPIAGADAIAWEWTLTGTNTGTWGGIQATRQQINLKGVGLMRVRNGRIVQVAIYYDTGTLNRQLGL